jgi:hypothetical protein
MVKLKCRHMSDGPERCEFVRRCISGGSETQDSRPPECKLATKTLVVQCILWLAGAIIQKWNSEDLMQQRLSVW